MAFIIEQNTNVINVIDTNMPDPSERIVGAFSLDSVAKPVPQTAPNLDKIRIYSANGDFLREFALDGTLQTQDQNAAPVTWSGTLDELSNKLNNDYFVNQTGSGSFPADYSNSGLQTDLKNLNTAKEKAFYFEFSDVEVEGNVLTFPNTLELTAADDAGNTEVLASATYNSLDALITAFNSGLTFYTLEKRSETSFYVLPNAKEINNKNALSSLIFTQSIFNVYSFRFYRLNYGTYPFANVSAQDLILDAQSAAKGTGFGEQLTIVNPTNVSFYNVKSISVIVKAVDGAEKIEIKESRAFAPAAYSLPFTLPSGNEVESFTKKFDRPSKNPITINNTGAATNEVVVSVIY